MMEESKVIFALYQFFTHEGGCSVKKLAFITYVGPGVVGLVKASAGAHRMELQTWFSAMTSIGQEVVEESVEGLKLSLGGAVNSFAPDSAFLSSSSSSSSVSSLVPPGDLSAASDLTSADPVPSPPSSSSSSPRSSSDTSTAPPVSLAPTASPALDAKSFTSASFAASSAHEESELVQEETPAFSPPAPLITTLTEDADPDSPSHVVVVRIHPSPASRNRSNSGSGRPRSNSRTRSRSNSRTSPVHATSPPPSTAAVTHTVLTIPEEGGKSNIPEEGGKKATTPKHMKNRLSFGSTLQSERSKLRSVGQSKVDQEAAAAAAVASAALAAIQEVELGEGDEPNSPNRRPHSLGAGHIDLQDQILAYMARKGHGSLGEIAKGIKKTINEVVAPLETLMKNGQVKVLNEGESPPLWGLAKAASFPLDMIKKKRAAVAAARARVVAERAREQATELAQHPPKPLLPPLRGGCACKAVRFEAKAYPQKTVLCHCEKCRRALGQAFSFSAIFKLSELEFTTGTPKEWLQQEQQEQKDEELVSNTRGFCAACGTSLFHKSSVCPDLVLLAVAVFDLSHQFPAPSCHLHLASALPQVVDQLAQAKLPCMPAHPSWPELPLPTDEQADSTSDIAPLSLLIGHI
eukprot:gb/GEZN01001985.1/.p1 GENE.gb/GEZN01001985.1/~~gb/GEZN01001985.1/.p1  ORF type:complete len:741 (+),score=154.64 gb/GEZN01001985.1/:323-2224(+)